MHAGAGTSVLIIISKAIHHSIHMYAIHGKIFGTKVFNTMLNKDGGALGNFMM